MIFCTELIEQYKTPISQKLNINENTIEEIITQYKSIKSDNFINLEEKKQLLKNLYYNSIKKSKNSIHYIYPIIILISSIFLIASILISLWIPTYIYPTIFIVLLYSMIVLGDLLKNSDPTIDPINSQEIKNLFLEIKTIQNQHKFNEEITKIMKTLVVSCREIIDAEYNDILNNFLKVNNMQNEIYRILKVNNQQQLDLLWNQLYSDNKNIPIKRVTSEAPLVIKQSIIDNIKNCQALLETMKNQINIMSGSNIKDQIQALQVGLSSYKNSFQNVNNTIKTISPQTKPNFLNSTKLYNTIKNDQSQNISSLTNSNNTKQNTINNFMNIYKKYTPNTTTINDLKNLVNSVKNAATYLPQTTSQLKLPTVNWQIINNELTTYKNNIANNLDLINTTNTQITERTQNLTNAQNEKNLLEQSILKNNSDVARLDTIIKPAINDYKSTLVTGENAINTFEPINNLLGLNLSYSRGVNNSYTTNFSSLIIDKLAPFVDMNSINSEYNTVAWFKVHFDSQLQNLTRGISYYDRVMFFRESCKYFGHISYTLQQSGNSNYGFFYKMLSRPSSEIPILPKDSAGIYTYSIFINLQSLAGNMRRLFTSHWTNTNNSRWINALDMNSRTQTQTWNFINTSFTGTNPLARVSFTSPNSQKVKEIPELCRLMKIVIDEFFRFFELSRCSQFFIHSEYNKPGEPVFAQYNPSIFNATCSALPNCKLMDGCYGAMGLINDGTNVGEKWFYDHVLLFRKQNISLLPNSPQLTSTDFEDNSNKILLANNSVLSAVINPISRAFTRDQLLKMWLFVDNLGGPIMPFQWQVPTNIKAVTTTRPGFAPVSFSQQILWNNSYVSVMENSMCPVNISGLIDDTGAHFPSKFLYNSNDELNNALGYGKYVGDVVPGSTQNIRYNYVKISSLMRFFLAFSRSAKISIEKQMSIIKNLSPETTTPLSDLKKFGILGFLDSNMIFDVNTSAYLTTSSIMQNYNNFLNQNFTSTKPLVQYVWYNNPQYMQWNSTFNTWLNGPNVPTMVKILSYQAMYGTYGPSEYRWAQNSLSPFFTNLLKYFANKFDQ